MLMFFRFAHAFYNNNQSVSFSIFNFGIYENNVVGELLTNFEFVFLALRNFAQ